MSRSTIVSRNGAAARHEPADRAVVAPAQDLGFRRFWLLAPERRLVGFFRHVLDAAGGRTRAPRKFGAADIAQDRQQPRLHRRAAIAVEMPQRAQVTFLHRVFGVGRVAQQIARQRVDVVEMRQGRVAKTPRLLRVVVRSVDRIALRSAVDEMLAPAADPPIEQLIALVSPALLPRSCRSCADAASRNIRIPGVVNVNE